MLIGVLPITVSPPFGYVTVIAIELSAELRAPFSGLSRRNESVAIGCVV
jgi:hypothetical protein